MSLGGGYSAAENTVVDNAVTAGVVVVVAAGNENTDAATKSPASAPTAITVGATDSADTRATFSNYGSVLDLFAPGVSIVSSVMTGGYESWSGTSMATPYAAGAAALLREKYPSYTAAQVNAAMVAAAKSGSVINPGTGSPNLLLQIEASVCACDDSNAATLDTCTSTGACVFTPIPCSDGDGCADFVSSAGQCILCAPTPSPPPANDPFAGAIAITSGQTITGSTATATRETGEPVPGTGASASIWYRFTAPSSGTSATVTLNGSSYDTLLAAYTGTAVNALTLVANNDADCPTGGAPASCVTFSITQGTVYSLQVDGFLGRKGSVLIAVTVTVAGDPVASPIPVSLAGLGSQSLTATTVGATRQVGEPVLFTGLGESASVWFSWTAPRAGVLRVNTQGSPFNTVLGVYRTSVPAGAPTFASLTLVTTNDNCTGVTTSCATVTVARGVRYLVKVDGAAGAKGAVTISFNLATV